MALRRSEIEVGDTYREVVVDDLTRTQIVQYAGASGDYNPLHTDEVFAREVAGYPTVFAHGMLTMAMTGRMVTDYVGDGRLASFGGRFMAQVWPGATLTATARVTGFGQLGAEPSVELEISTTDEAGNEVFRGTAVARIDD